MSILSHNEKKDKRVTLEEGSGSIEIAALPEKTDSAYEDIVNLALKEDAVNKAIEEATGVKPLELGVDVETPQMRDKQRQTQIDSDDENDESETIIIGQRTLSQLTTNLASMVTYEEFEKEETKKIASRSRDSFEIWDSSEISEIDFPEMDESRIRPVMDKTTFIRTFKNITHIPSITELSLASTRAPSIAVEKLEEERKESVDPGYFVDPLTGEMLVSHYEEEKSITPESSPSISSTISSESEIILQVSEDEDILIATQQLDERDRALIPEKPDDDLAEKEMAAFLEEIGNVPSEVLEMRLSDLLKQQNAAEKSKKIIQDFLDGLIGHVVFDVEYVDPETVLRKNLDKSKLLDTLLHLVLSLRGEQHISALLNRKVAEHFRRKKAFRNIIEVNVDELKEDMQKYYYQMENLDVYLGYEFDAIKNKRLLEEKVQNQLQELNDSVEEEIANFEALVRNAFIRPESSERYVTVSSIILKQTFL